MIRELKTLIAVAREGTFAAAGEKIGLTQAAVSAQMQRLQDELGFALFDRAGRTAQLNARGHQTLQQAQELVSLYGELGSRRSGRNEAVFLTLGAIASAQRSWLPKAIAKFHRACPGARTRILPGLSMEFVNQVDAGEIDMAIVIKPPFGLHADLRWTTLAREPFRLLVPRDAPQAGWAELIRTQPFVRYDRASFGGRQADRFLRSMHIAVQQVSEVDELEAIVQLVAHGVGVALIPQTANHRRWPAAVRAVDLGEHTFYRDIGLIHRRARTMSEHGRQLAGLIVDAHAAALQGAADAHA